MRVKKIVVRVVECGHGKYRAFRFDSESRIFQSDTQEGAIAACVAAHASMFEDCIVTAHNESSGFWSARLSTDDDARDGAYSLGVTKKIAMEALCASRWQEFATPLFPSPVYG